MRLVDTFRGIIERTERGTMTRAEAIQRVSDAIVQSRESSINSWGAAIVPALEALGLVRFDQREDHRMELGTALHILAQVHTKDDRTIGFAVEMGSAPAPFDCPEADYIEAWRAVRQHIGRPVNPGEYPR